MTGTMLAGPPKEKPQSPRGSTKLRSRSKSKIRVPKVDLGRGPPLTLPPLSRTPRSRGRRPPTFGFESLIGRSTVLLAHRPPSPLLSLVELPGLIAQYGPGIALGDSLWMEGPGLVASALGAHIPVMVASDPPALTSADSCLPPPNEARDAPAVAGGGTGGSQETGRTRARLTGPQVVEVLAEQSRRRGGALEFYYLKESCGDEYRPYDLEVVRPSRAGPDHYVFSPSTVLQVTPQGPGALVSLEDWRREAGLWGALRTIPFFRDYGLHRAFTWWRKAVSRIVFQRKCDALQDTLLIAVPQFRHALVLLTGVNQELVELRWLPSARRRRSYAPREFRDALLLNGRRSLETLAMLLRRRAAILTALHQQCYQACQDLQPRVQRAAKEPTDRRRPRHLHLARRRRLEAELERAARASLALGRVASLANQMTVQGLCTLSQREVTSFLGDVIERGGGQQAGLFQTRLALAPQGGLAVDPDLQLSQDEVQEALLGFPGKLLQVCDSCGLFLETTDSRSPGAFQGQCEDINHEGTPREGTPREGGPSEGRPSEGRPSEWPAFSAVLPWSNPLAVQGRRLRGCCVPLSRSCLERQLAASDVSEEAGRRWAGIMQEAQAEVQRLCGGYAWLADVRSFTDQWGASSSLRALRGGAASAYQELVEEVRRWSDRIHSAPRSFATADRLVVVDASGVLEELGVQLGAIEEEIFSQLVEELRLQSEDLVTQLRSTISGLADDPRDLRGFALYASMVKRESSSPLMQHRMESLHSLRCAVTSSYRKRSCQEGVLEEQIQGLWRSYVHLLKAAEQKVLQHLPSMSEALERSFAALVGELSRTVSAAAAAASPPSGVFLDPGADAQEMCAELRVLCTQVHAFGRKLRELDRVSEELRGEEGT